MDKIKNKVVLITGAAGGIGYKTAEELLRNGVQAITILDANASLGHTSVTTLQKEFGKNRVIFLQCDVCQQDQLKESFEKTLETFKRLDIVINNAGIANEQLVEQVMNINATATIRGSLLAIDYMGKHKNGNGGTVVNVASMAGLFPTRCIPVYVASKYAVVGFSRAIQQHYDKTGVRVLVMCPGVTVSPMTTKGINTLLNFIDIETFNSDAQSHPPQPTEHVARSMVELIQKGKNGTVCVVRDSMPPYGVEFTDYDKTKYALE